MVVSCSPTAPNRNNECPKTENRKDCMDEDFLEMDAQIEQLQVGTTARTALSMTKYHHCRFLSSP